METGVKEVVNKAVLETDVKEVVDKEEVGVTAVLTIWINQSNSDICISMGDQNSAPGWLPTCSFDKK